MARENGDTMAESGIHFKLGEVTTHDSGEWYTQCSKSKPFNDELMILLSK